MNTIEKRLNDVEIDAEKAYRRAERIAILTEGQRDPTVEETLLAAKDAREWEKRYRTENQ